MTDTQTPQTDDVEEALAAMRERLEAKFSQGWEQEGAVATASYSALGTHRSCPNQWRYKYLLHVGKPEGASSPSRIFGTWYGVLRSAEALERGRSMESLVGEPGMLKIMPELPRLSHRSVTVRDIRILARKWWKTRPLELREEFVEALGEELPDRLDQAFIRWRDEYGEVAKKEAPLGVEIFWKRALPTLGASPWDSAPEVELLGYVDELYRDLERGSLVVRDNKTSKRMEAASSAADMMDSQLYLYAWGIESWLQEHGIKERVKAVSYDRILSAKPATPTLTKAGGLSKSVTNYDLRTYLAWASNGVEFPGTKKDGSGAGVYYAEESVIEKLSTPAWKSKFLQRTYSPVSRALAQAHLRAAVDSARAIVETQKRVATDGDAPRNLTKLGCSWCDFADLCRAEMIGGVGGEYELAQFGLVARDGREYL